MTDDTNRIWCWYTRETIVDDQPCIYCKEFDCYISRKGFDICREASADPEDQEAQLIWEDIKWALDKKEWMDLPVDK